MSICVIIPLRFISTFFANFTALDIFKFARYSLKPFCPMLAGLLSGNCLQWTVGDHLSNCFGGFAVICKVGEIRGKKGK